MQYIFISDQRHAELLALNTTDWHSLGSDDSQSEPRTNRLLMVHTWPWKFDFSYPMITILLNVVNKTVHC